MSAVKKKGLGRGLDALLGDAPRVREIAETAPASPAQRAKHTLPIEFLSPGKDQPRRVFNEDAINELAQSISARGLLQPILVRPAGGERYEIVAGERRWRAAQRAKLHDVPVIIRELTDEEAAEIALIENVQRVDLNPIEEARAYQRLSDVYGRTQDQIAKAVGKSRAHVTNTLRLLALPAKAFDALEQGTITPGHARAILAAPKPQVLLEVILQDGLSVRETEQFLKHLTAPDTVEAPARSSKGGATPAPKKASGGGKKDADTRALESDLAAALGLEVEIDHSAKGAGSVTIRYLDLDQLDDICRRLMGAGV